MAAPARRRSTAGLAGRRRARGAPSPLADRDWIVADLHLHTTWSHDCQIPVEELLDHAEAEGLGAIAVTDHNVFGGALEAVDARPRPRARRDPGRGGEDGRPGRGDRPLPLGGDPARALVRRDRRRDPRAGRDRLPPPPVRPAARDPGAGDAAPAPRRDRRVRGLQRAPALRGLQRRGAPLRAQVRPHDGRRLRRARPPGRRHGRRADARLHGAGGVPRLPAQRPGAAPPEVARSTCSR